MNSAEMNGYTFVLEDTEPVVELWLVTYSDGSVLDVWMDEVNFLAWYQRHAGPEAVSFRCPKRQEAYTNAVTGEEATGRCRECGKLKFPSQPHNHEGGMG